MNKIIRYELHRMVCSRIFAGMACVLLWYGWQVLNRRTILGVAHTAPFSPWSFGSYLSGLTPLLCLCLMFFLWETCSGPAKRVELLADATYLGHGRLLAAKGCAAAIAWLVLYLGISILGIVFLIRLFGASVPVGELLAVTAFELFPVLLFYMGVGLSLGRFHGELLFLLLPVTCFYALAPLPMGAQLFAGDFFSIWPAGQVLDPDFIIPNSVIIGRVLYAGLGIAGIVASERVN